MLATVVLIATALASFATGFRYSYLDHYMLIQFLLVGAWLFAAVLLAIYWGKTYRLAVWLLIAFSAPIALFLPGQIVALLLSFTFQGFV